MRERDVGLAFAKILGSRAGLSSSITSLWFASFHFKFCIGSLPKGLCHRAVTHKCRDEVYVVAKVSGQATKDSPLHDVANLKRVEYRVACACSRKPTHARVRASDLQVHQRL